MKKLSIIKISAAAVLILIIFFVVGTLRYRPTPPPTFKFLSGCGSYIRIDRLETKVKRTSFLYSIETDYHPIVADANSELSALDYIIKSSWIKDPPMIEYYLPGRKQRDGISVWLRADFKMFPTPENYENKKTTNIAFARNEGWISVEIRETKEVSWFIYGFLRLLNKLRRPGHEKDVTTYRE